MRKLLPVLILVACGGANAPATSPAPTGIGLPAPSRSIQLRAAFDKDPSVYIGRFVPDGVLPGDIDENSATVTRCSKFIKPKTVETEQTMDETMYVSRRASAQLGIPVIANLAGTTETKNEVRVRYTVTKKIQSDVDADGLAQCCKADASQCTGKIIGEFLMGTGDVLQSSRDTGKYGASVTTPQQVQGSASYGSDDGWKKTTSFKDVYFAFLTQATPLSLASRTGATANDCSWCDALPGSLDGKYFCGVSPDAPDESAARTLAMRAAREQVVRYLGETLTMKSTATKALASALQSQDIVSAASDGIASQVKDEKWCQERIPTPDGEKIRAKVLAFYPKTAEDAGRGAVTAAATASKKK